MGFLLALGCSVCYGTASVLQAVATRSVEPASNSGVDALLLMRAVRQWRYQPTLLNGEPVEVDTEIDVIFSLAQ